MQRRVRLRSRPTVWEAAMAERGRQLVLDYYDSEKNARRMIELISAHAAPAAGQA